MLNSSRLTRISSPGVAGNNRWPSTRDGKALMHTYTAQRPSSQTRPKRSETRDPHQIAELSLDIVQLRLDRLQQAVHDGAARALAAVAKGWLHTVEEHAVALMARLDARRADAQIGVGARVHLTFNAVVKGLRLERAARHVFRAHACRMQLVSTARAHAQQRSGTGAPSSIARNMLAGTMQSVLRRVIRSINAAE